MTSVPKETRRAYLDWARGIAVLLMIEAHTIDAWTRLADKGTLAYGYGTVFGGFAAPMFLWLAGLGVVLSAARTLDRTGSRAEAVRAVCTRGVEIFLLGFLFRLQAFVVSPGSHPVTLFRVDVLNVMGPAMAAAGLVFALHVGTTGRVLVYSVLAIAVAMATPIVRAAGWVGRLPLFMQWYLQPTGDFSTFMLFPWAAFVFAGAASGVLVASIRDSAAERRLQVVLGLAGIALIALGYYSATRPTIYSVPSSFWASSPAFFALRLGVLMVALSTLAMVDRRIAGTRAAAWLAPVAAMGRASLFIYFIHVELVYGYASWLWRHRLPLWAWAIAYVAFAVLMYRAIGWRDAWLARRRRAAARCECQRGCSLGSLLETHPWRAPT
jgi:uncharacterized membrane protein